MLKENQLTRKDGYIAVGVLFILLTLAIAYMKLRMLYMDASFMLINFVNAGYPMIQEHRYGSIITQMWPWLGAEMGISLTGLMHMYNASFNLFYLTVGALLVFKWKEYGLAILLALYFTLMAGSTFYWTNNEIHQAMGWTFIWWGLYRYQLRVNRSIGLRYTTFGLSGIMAAMTHPLIVPIMIFIWLFEILSDIKAQGKYREIIIFSLLLSLGIGLRVFFSFYAGWYDQDKISTVQSGLLTSPLALFKKPLASALISKYLGSLIGATMFFLTSFFLLVHKRKYILLAAYLGIILAYHLLFLAAFDNWVDFYSVSELIPLTIIYALPTIYYAPQLVDKRIISTALLAIFALCILIIYQAAEPYKLRLEKTTTYLEQMRSSDMTKALIVEDETHADTYIMTWALPSESLLTSLTSEDGIARTFKIIPAADTTAFLQTPANHFLDCFKEVPIDEMNLKYFPLDSTDNYRILK